jgi:inorganic pyrophosphatase
MDSKSFVLAKQQLDKKIKITIDRQLGTKHPKWNYIYPINSGYIKGVLAPDGCDLDAYLLKVDKPVSTFEGRAVAIIHRLNDDDDKVIVLPEGETITDAEIDKIVEFQEKWFKHIIVRK